MTNSPNLDIPHLQPNSDQPEVPVNAAIDALDNKITKIVTLSVTSSNTYTTTQDEQAGGSIFVLAPGGSPGPTAGFTVNFQPFGMGLCSIFNNTGQTATLRISGQALATPTWAAAARGIFQCDGVNVVKLV